MRRQSHAVVVMSVCVDATQHMVHFGGLQFAWHACDLQVQSCELLEPSGEIQPFNKRTVQLRGVL